VSLANLTQGVFAADAVRVNAISPVGPSAIVGVLDIENENSLVTVGSLPSATEFTFTYVVNDGGLFTGVAIATGNTDARITVDVYGPAGGTPKSESITLGANQHLGQLIWQLVTGLGPQVGGYIRIRSDQPVWSWVIYGSGTALASGPPQ
jgi:hypothetical protein